MQNATVRLQFLEEFYKTFNIINIVPITRTSEDVTGSVSESL